MKIKFYRIDSIVEESNLKKLILREWTGKTWNMSDLYVPFNSELNKNDLVKVEIETNHIQVTKVDRTYLG